MKLDTIENQLISIITHPQGVDMDAVTKLGPQIARHLNAVSNLCDIIPNMENMKEKINDLKALFATYIPMQDNVLEKTSIQENVIYDLDIDDPMNKSEVLILGGAGRLTMKSLRDKIKREADMLARDVTGEYVEYRHAAHNIKQLSNSINTMVAALNELNAIRSKGGMKSRNIIATEQHLQNPVHPSVQKLEDQLASAAKGGRKLSYDDVDSIMQKICKNDRVSPNDLHNMWTASHAGWTPDQWVKNSPSVTDVGVHESTASLMENPLLIGAGRALITAAPVVARNVGQVLRWAFKKPVVATGAGVAVTHPVETFNIIANPQEAAIQAANGAAWLTFSAAVNGINKLVGSNMTPEAVYALASVAVKYALPIAAVVAVLYGGKKLYDFLTSHEPSAETQATAQATAAKAVAEMYCSMKSNIGESAAWVNTKKKMINAGYERDLVEELINKAVLLEEQESSHRSIEEGMLANIRDAVTGTGKKVFNKIVDKVGISKNSIETFYHQKGTELALAIDEYPTPADLEQPTFVKSLISKIVEKLSPNNSNNEELISAINSTIQGTITGVINTGKPQIIIPIIGIVAWHYISKRLSEEAALDQAISSSYVIEMYETLKLGMGDRAWVAISKRLVSEGHNPKLVSAMINRAIATRS